MAAHLARQVAQGLACAHDHTDGKDRPRPIIHGDLTPANVLVSRSGKVKLADFGIAEVSRGAPVEPALLAGKAGYLSPEQVQGRAIDARSDLFSLGIVLYELLGGGRLFGDDEAALEAVARFKASSLSPPPAATPPLWEVLRRLLQPDPDRRPASAFDLVEDLRASAGALGEAEVRALFARAFPQWTSPLEGTPAEARPLEVTPVQRPRPRPRPPPPEAPLQALGPTPTPTPTVAPSPVAAPEPMLAPAPLPPGPPPEAPPLGVQARLERLLDGPPRMHVVVTGSGLGHLLVQQGRLSAARLQELERQAGDRRLEEVLVETGALSDEQLLEVLSAQSGLALLKAPDLAALHPARELLQRLPRSWAERLVALPVAQAGTSLVVVLAEPALPRTMSSLRSVTGSSDVRTVLAPSGPLKETISRAYEAHGLHRQPLLGRRPLSGA
jgi:hypothetical protein